MENYHAKRLLEMINDIDVLRFTANNSTDSAEVFVIEKHLIPIETVLFNWNGELLLFEVFQQ